MKIKLSFYLFFFITCFSAQSRITDVLIVKLNGDSIKVKLNISMFEQKGKIHVDENDFFRKLKTVDSDGNKLVIYKPNEIRELSFNDLSNKKRIYHKDPSKNQLMELIYNGKMKCYMQFTAMNGYNAIYFLFLQPDGQPFPVGLFENNKKIMLRITSSKPEMKNKIESLAYVEGSIAELLAEFEKS